MWLKQFKIALIEKDIEKLNNLADDLPSLQSDEEREEAVYLFNEASRLVESLKQDTADSMAQLRKNLNFLKSTQMNKSHKFDIKS